MKKILSLVLALMMVLSMTSVAFAGTFEDLKDSDARLKDAADLLSGLKIIEGFPDGEFKPENGVTRAQMAVMILKARGLASIATDTPSFTDSQTHWAAGYIALAADLGIIEGKGNGIFDPDGKVTFEQAAAMLLRALGYTNESINSGRSEAYNGANYRAKAISLNLFRDLKDIVMNNPANRGQVALMLTRNLNNFMVDTDDRGRAVVREPKEILLAAVADKNSDLSIVPTTKAVESFDLAPYMYQTVVAYTVKDADDNDLVLYVEKSLSETATGTISTTTAPTNTTVTIGTKTYAVATSAGVYFNGAVGGFEFGTHFADLAGASATLVLNDAKTTVLGISATKQTSQVFITAPYRKDASVLNGISLPTKGGKVDLSKVTVTGAVDSIEDIEKNDVVKAYAPKNISKINLLVVRDSIEGKVTKANNAGTSVYINSLDKTVSSKVVFKSDDDNKFFNVDGTFFFDENGNVFNFIPEKVSVATSYAMVTSAKDGVMLNNGAIMFKNPVIKTINAAGETTTYTVAENAKYDIIKLDGTTSTNQALYTTASAAALLDVNVKEGEIVKSVTVKDNQLVKIVLEQTKVETALVNVKAKTFNPASNVVVFNYNSTPDPVIATVNSLSDLVAMGEVEANKFAHIKNDKGEYSVIVVLNDTIVAPASNYALIVGQQKVVNSDGKTVQELVVYVNGERHTYLTKAGVADYTAGASIWNLAISGELVTNDPTPVPAAPIKFAATSTGSAIKSVLTTRFQAKDEVSGNTDWYFMDDDAPIYIVDNTSSNKFVRIGSIADLEGYNFEAYVYQIGNIVNNIVIILK